MGFIDHVLPHTEYTCGFGHADGDGEKCGQCFQNDAASTLRPCSEDVAIDFLKKVINSVPLRLSVLLSEYCTEMLQSSGQINCLMGSITFKMQVRSALLLPAVLYPTTVRMPFSLSTPALQRITCLGEGQSG